MKTLKSLPKGCFYKLSESSKTVYQKIGYNRAAKKFDSQNQTTCNYVQHKGEKMVFIDFEY